MATEAALDALARTPPRSLVQLTPRGTRQLHDIFIACRRAGLSSARPADDVACLHALFDIALSRGLGCLIYEYVTDVCADSTFTSSNALEAYLLDGECVQGWCERALENEWGSAARGLALGCAALEGGASARAALGRLNALLLVMQALASVAMRASGPATVATEARSQQPADAVQAAPGAAPADMPARTQQLQLCLQVLAWCAEQKLSAPGAGGAGHFTSDAEWRAAVAQRRLAVQPRRTFLQATLECLAHETGAQVAYPPTSLGAAVRGMFLAGAPGASPASGPRQRSLRLELFVYYLMDAGHGDAAASLGRCVGVEAAQVAEWRARFWLDDAALGEAGNVSVNLACAALLGAARPGMPLELAEALAARGRPDAALAVLRARGSGHSPAQPGADLGPGSCPKARGPQSGPPALEEAIAALEIRLATGLLIEAYTEAHQQCRDAAAAAQPLYARALMCALCARAAAAGALDAVIQLPFDKLEEQVVCDWLGDSAVAGRPEGSFLPLFFLARGRVAEALLAHARIAAALPTAGAASEQAGTLGVLLEAAAQLLPAPLRALAVAPHREGAPLLQLATSAEADALPLVSGWLEGTERSSATAALLVRPGRAGLTPLLGPAWHPMEDIAGRAAACGPTNGAMNEAGPGPIELEAGEELRVTDAAAPALLLSMRRERDGGGAQRSRWGGGAAADLGVAKPPQAVALPGVAASAKDAMGPAWDDFMGIAAEFPSASHSKRARVSMFAQPGM